MIMRSARGFMPQPPALRLRSLVLEGEAALSPPLLPQPLRPQHASHHMAHTISCRVRSRELFARPGNIQPLGRYYHHRTLRWAGHGARMPVSRLPRKLPTGSVVSGPCGTPQRISQRPLSLSLSLPLSHNSLADNAQGIVSSLSAPASGTCRPPTAYRVPGYDAGTLAR
jgi:hypothetical protein